MGDPDMSLHQAFLAGFTRRWHCNPELAHTDDRVDGHSARVARIILMWHPELSVALIAAALRHDDGEMGIGDMCAPFKRARPDIADALAKIEDSVRFKIWNSYDGDLTDTDAHWLVFADRLDALMWAAHHRADLSRDGWAASRAWLAGNALALDCHQQFEALQRRMIK